MLAKSAPINIKRVSKYEYIIAPMPLNIPLLVLTNITNFRCNTENIKFSAKKAINISLLYLNNIRKNINIIIGNNGIPIRTLE